jgi:FkbH-like protein
MKLIDALKILAAPVVADAESRRIYLASGMNPVHLQTFVAAHVTQRIQPNRVDIGTGLYGDLLGNIDRMGEADCDTGIVVIEWTDLDARLGMRSLGSWAPDALKDILSGAISRLAELEFRIRRASRDAVTIVVFPTLPLAPVAFVPGWQAGTFELSLRQEVTAAAARLGQLLNVRVMSGQRLDLLSPLAERYDAAADLSAGFPYTLSHASVLGETLATLVESPAPKKGIITDLDNTLWKGIVGEDGILGIAWDLEHGAQLHGAYQRLLHSLAASGVLVAVASKNDPILAEEVFEKCAPVLPRGDIFPFEANWSPKSEAVRRIVTAWNLGPEAVVFVDDSPMELAEVQTAFPEMMCLQFPAGNPCVLDRTLYKLRDLFGKYVVLEEDGIRAQSLKGVSSEMDPALCSSDSLNEFLRRTEPQLTFSSCKEPVDPRAFELVNKTNQFNLNGRRFTEKSWKSYLQEDETFLCVVAYKDKFGPLGKIAVLAGRVLRGRTVVDVWVMSCRAFSRRIEHACIERLFAKFEPDEIEFDYRSTPRNGPITAFLENVLGETPKGRVRLSRAVFCERKPQMFHSVAEVAA